MRDRLRRKREETEADWRSSERSAHLSPGKIDTNNDAIIDALRGKLLSAKEKVLKKDSLIKNQKYAISMLDSRLRVMREFSMQLRDQTNELKNLLLNAGIDIPERLQTGPAIDDDVFDNLDFHEMELDDEPSQSGSPQRRARAVEDSIVAKSTNSEEYGLGSASKKEYGSRMLPSRSSRNEPFINKSGRGNITSSGFSNFSGGDDWIDSNFTEFQGGEILKAALDAQLNRSDMSGIMTYLLGHVSKEVFIHKSKTILYECMAAFISIRNIQFNHDIDNFLPKMIELLSEIVESERCTLYMYDKDRDELYSRALVGDYHEPIVIKRSSPTIPSHVFTSGKHVMSKNPFASGNYVPVVDKKTRYVTTNILCVPIRMEKTALGVLELINKKAGNFSEQDLRFVTLVANQIASGLVAYEMKSNIRAEMEKEAAKKKEIVSKSQDLFMNPTVNYLCQTVSQLLNSERTSIFLYDAESDMLRTKYAQDVDEEIEVRAEEGIVGRSFKSNEVLVINEPYQCEFFGGINLDKKHKFRTKNVIAVPVLNRKTNQPFGVLQSLNKKNGVFGKADEHKMVYLANLLSIIMFSAENLENVFLINDLTEIMIQCIGDSIILIDAEGRITKINQSASKLLGVESTHVVGKLVSEIFVDQNSHISDTFYQLISSKQKKLCLENTRMFSISDETVAAHKAEFQPRRWGVTIQFLNLDDLAKKGFGFLMVVAPLRSEKKTLKASNTTS